MIQQLQGHITDNQIHEITRIICAQYREFLQLVRGIQFNRVFSDEYAPHNRQHSVSWAISSGFHSNTTIGDTLQISRLLYGRGHARPIISNDVIELLVLNKTTHFDANYLKERYRYNSNQFANNKLFAYIRFSVEQSRLIDVRLCLPDENGEVVAEMVLLDRQDIQNIAA